MNFLIGHYWEVIEMVNIKAPENLDYEKEGLMIGLEFHQQIYAPYHLDSHSELEITEGSKLFCPCPAVIQEKEPDLEIIRQLRAVSGETGEVDITAKFEKSKNQMIHYEYYKDTNCLVELDEEPIHPVNPNALLRVIAISKNLFNLQIFDELLVCRKTIIDGSNTSGFQRTIQVAYGNEDSFITVNGKKIKIYQVNLEEDSAKNMGKFSGYKKFSLDRLGIPLIEIATDPDMNSPEEVLSVASRIGELLRTTKFVKRGLGTIRQDINVSITKGTRVEIKGVQELALLPEFVKNEAIRQYRMLEFLSELENRNFDLNKFLKIKSVDLTKILSKSDSNLVKKAIKQKHKVIGLKLPKLSGMLGYELQEGYRLGTELSEVVKVLGGGGGIIHSDELPKFGINEEEVDLIRDALKADSNDAFAISFGKKTVVERGFTSIKEIFKLWIESETLLPEVRAPRSDGTTGFLRPLPGQARMYPETDILPIDIGSEIFDKLNNIVFELPEDRIDRYHKDFSLSMELAERMSSSPENELFEKLVNENSVEPVLVASTLLNTMVELRREDLDISKINETVLGELFKAVSDSTLNKSKVPEVLRAYCLNPKNPIQNYIIEYSKGTISEEDLVDFINDLVLKNKKLIIDKEMRSVGGLMGDIMKFTKGNVDGKKANKFLVSEIKKILNQS